MAGTKAGGRAAAETNKKKYGADFYAKIGSKGGKLGHTGGFFADRELARAAGAKGGRISKRGSRNATTLTQTKPLQDDQPKRNILTGKYMDFAPLRKLTRVRNTQNGS